MVVKMKTQTRFGGVTVKRDDTLTVPDAIADRWVKKGIAEFVEQHVEANTTEEVDELVSKTAKELYEMCLEKGIDVEAKQKKAVYIEALNSVE